MASLDPYLQQVRTLSGGTGGTTTSTPTPTPTTTNLTTGGPYPPVPVTTTTSPLILPSGGGYPAVPVNGNTGIVPPTLPSGGGYPPVPATTQNPLTLPSGGGYPPVSAGGGLTLPGGEDGRVPVNQTPPQSPGNFGPAQTVNDMLNSFLNGQYAQNAYRRGVEQAGARGLMNSSIAGGQAQRAALEAVQPFVSQGMSLLGDRENRAFQSQESQLDRLFRQQMQNDSVLQQNWLQTNQFNNQFNAQLSMLPIQNSMQMLQAIMQMGLEDPETFTPQAMSGFSNFFNNTMLSLLGQYFPNRVTYTPANPTTPPTSQGGT